MSLLDKSDLDHEGYLKVADHEKHKHHSHKHHSKNQDNNISDRKDEKVLLKNYTSSTAEEDSIWIFEP